jgi:hypothetical protein
MGSALRQQDPFRAASRGMVVISVRVVVVVVLMVVVFPLGGYRSQLGALRLQRAPAGALWRGREAPVRQPFARCDMKYQCGSLP